MPSQTYNGLYRFEGFDLATNTRSIYTHQQHEKRMYSILAIKEDEKEPIATPPPPPPPPPTHHTQTLHPNIKTRQTTITSTQTCPGRASCRVWSASLVLCQLEWRASTMTLNPYSLTSSLHGGEHTERQMNNQPFQTTSSARSYKHSLTITSNNDLCYTQELKHGC